MAITIDPGINSWVTITEAKSYFDEKWGANSWNDGTLNEIQQSQLLISAYRWINQQFNLSIPAASSAQTVKNAQMEAAWFIYSYWTEYEKIRSLSAAGVTQFRVSSFSESLSDVKFPEFILKMLSDFLVNDGGYFPRLKRDLSDV